MKEKPQDRRHRLRSAKSARRAHVHERHGHAAPPSVVPLQAVPISIDGRLVGELLVQAGTEEQVTARALATLTDLGGWSQLGGEIADLGEHRLELAAHAARVAAAGGRGVSAEEEAQIADWFRGIVQTAIQRGGMHAARAIWSVLVFDNQRDPRGTWAPRCPALNVFGVPPNDLEDTDPSKTGEEERAAWLAAFPEVAVSYVYHAVASATAEDVTELRELIHADDDTIDALYAPGAPRARGS